MREIDMRHQLRCAEVWGGVRHEDVDACSATLEASLFSLAADGGEGGDLYYFSVCSGDRLTRFAVADVVGHGERVTTVSRWMYEAMRDRMNSLDGGGVLRDLNRLAADRGLCAMTTAVVAAFYKTDHHCYVSYAGHHEMLLLRSGATRWEPIRVNGGRQTDAHSNLPLGVLEDTMYDQDRLPLRSGDRVALYTDGVIEAPSGVDAHELFGLDRLLNVLNADPKRSPCEVKRAVLHALLSHTGGSLAHDDVTLLVAEMK
jgi:sigma-B regulation protein RsbU (phosphoserine phosphatase)